MDRLGGSVGKSLLATFFQLREQGYASSALTATGSSPSDLQLADTALHSFRDTILLLTTVSFIGFAIAMLLKTGDAAE